MSSTLSLPIIHLAWRQESSGRLFQANIFATIKSPVRDVWAVSLGMHLNSSNISQTLTSGRRNNYKWVKTQEPHSLPCPQLHYIDSTHAVDQLLWVLLQDPCAAARLPTPSSGPKCPGGLLIKTLHSTLKNYMEFKHARWRAPYFADLGCQDRAWNVCCGDTGVASVMDQTPLAVQGARTWFWGEHERAGGNLNTEWVWSLPFYRCHSLCIYLQAPPFMRPNMWWQKTHSTHFHCSIIEL